MKSITQSQSMNHQTLLQKSLASLSSLDLSQESLLKIVNENPSLLKALTPKLNKYISWTPSPKQQAFLLLDCKDAFYGGAAGGGKSVALLMAALQWVEVPGYDALLIRDTYANLSKPKSLIPLAHAWLQGTDAKWTDGNHYLFPSGATLNFGYLSSPLDHFNYQGPSYNFIGLDEIVQIRKNQADYLFSRLRKPGDIPAPTRYRCASNPPAREQIQRGSWVKDKYVNPKTRKKGVTFISAKLDDNEHLDKEDYRDSLSNLDPITRRQLEDGDWEIRAEGNMFKREWFPIVETSAVRNIKWIRYWDLAHTEHKEGKSERDQPAFTAGALVGMTPDGLFFIKSIIRDQLSPRNVEALVRQTADIDGLGVHIWMEQEPAGGKALIDHYRRNILRGFVFRGHKKGLSKAAMWAPFASQAEAGNVLLVNGPWISDFFDEIVVAPDGDFLDQLDCVSGAMNKLCGIESPTKVRIRSVG